MKKYVLIALALIVTFLLSPGALGDTGTYQITEYKVLLEPHYNGTVDITCLQTWTVTSGHIPWVTVGLPNSNFKILEAGGAAKTISPENGGGWSGVRVDLDKDYQPQESFTFFFRVRQGNLLNWKDDHYQIIYTPGWYDRAATDSLMIKAIYPTTINVTSFSPEPVSRKDGEAMWSTALGRGEKYTIRMDFPNGTYNPALASSQKANNDDQIASFLLMGLFALIAILMIASVASAMFSHAGNSSSYGGKDSIRERRSSYRDDDDAHITPILYTSPTIRSGSSGGSSSSRSSDGSSGGGGFSGRVSSCHCACVACACACACAGGGGAGCTKKGIHMCPSCSKPEEMHDKDNKN